MCEVAACLLCDSAGVSAPAAAAPSGVVTFLFTDVEGSTRAPTMQPSLRPARPAPTGRCRGLDRVLHLTVAFRYRQHGYAFQPEHHRRTTVVHHLGPFIRVRNTTNHEAQAHFRTQPANRVDPPLPRLIEKSRKPGQRSAG